MKDLLEYDPDTGLLRWKVRRGSRCAHGWFAGTTKKLGYRAVCVDGKLYYVHRLAWYLTHGEWPHVIDHINRDPSDNRLVNLRNVTQAENNHNARRFRNNTTGTTGVFWHEPRNLWRARIAIKGQKIYLGYFKNKQDAINARRTAEHDYAEFR